MRSALALAAAAALCLPAAARQAGQEGTTPPPAEQGPKLPRVGAVVVEGEERYTESQLVAALGQRIGEPLDPAAVDRGILRLYQSFKVHAEVSYRPLEEDPGAIELRLTVQELASDREPRFVGNDGVETKTLLEWAQLEERTELFLHQAKRARQRILEGYRSEGYAFAEVNVVSRSEGPEGLGGRSLSDVIFEIREGPKVRVKEVAIEGNVSMPDTRFLYFFKDGLSHYAKRDLEGPGLFNWRGSPFVRETLDADLLALRGVYRDRGWLDAVVELRALEFSPDRSRVRVRIQVDEGPRYRVSAVHVEAWEWEDPEDERSAALRRAELLFPEAELLEQTKLRPGSFFEKAAIDRDRIALRDFYGSRGHLSHDSLPRRVNWSFEEPLTTWDVERREVDVTYRLVQGRPLTIREIRFAGPTHTRDRVLRREVSVFPGKRADLVEIHRSLARIQGTGFFQDEFDRLEHRDPTFRFLEVRDEPDQVDLLFEVEEGRVVDFQVQGGVDSNLGAFGLVSMTLRNFDLADPPASPASFISEVYDKQAFHGAGQRLDIEVSPGTLVNRARLHFLEPDLFQSHLDPISLDLDLQKRLRIYATHDEDRFEKRVRLGRRFGFDTSVALGFLHSDIEVDDLDDDDAAFFAPLVQQEQAGQQQLAGPTLDFNRRSLDNFIVPKNGYRLSASAAVNDETFGSDFEFTEVELHYDWYRGLWEKEDGTSPTLHLEFDGGVSAPHGDTLDVPYTERYMLGGQSLRGFDFRGVGPFDLLTGLPLGGESYLGGSFEFHYPLHSVKQPGTYRTIESLRGTLFLDWGVLDKEAFQLRADELRASAGFAVGLAWPIPISVSFGFPLIERDGDQLEVFAFSITAGQ